MKDGEWGESLEHGEAEAREAFEKDRARRRAEETPMEKANRESAEKAFALWRSIFDALPASIDEMTVEDWRSLWHFGDCVGYLLEDARRIEEEFDRNGVMQLQAWQNEALIRLERAAGKYGLSAVRLRRGEETFFRLACEAAESGGDGSLPQQTRKDLLCSKLKAEDRKALEEGMEVLGELDPRLGIKHTVAEIREWVKGKEPARKSDGGIESGRPKDLISVGVACRECGISKSTLHRARVAGEIHGYRPPQCRANAAYSYSRAEVTSKWSDPRGR